MCKDVEARYERQLAEKDSAIRKLTTAAESHERQLAEKDSTIRKLITIGESKTGEGSVLRAELRRMYGELDEERSSRQEADRVHDMELADLRAAQARELSQIRSGNPSESGNGSGNGSKKEDQDGEALSTSPHTPSSKNPVMYSQKKRYWAEKVAECERVNGGFQPDPNDPGRCVFCHRRHGPTARVGPPPGHEGHDVRWVPTKSITIRVVECGNEKCCNRKLRRVDVRTKVYVDSDGDRRAIVVMCAKREVRHCKKCGTVTTAPDPTIPGTFIGKNLAALMCGWHTTSRTPSDTVRDMKVLFKGKFAQNTIRNCALTVAENCLQSSRAEIMEAIRAAAWIGIDETPIIINGKRGYVWLVRTDKATYVAVTPSRAGEVIPTFFAELVGKKAMVDGYRAYPRFFDVCRCWSHELAQAENLAIKGGVGSLHDVLFDKLRHIYYTALVMSIKGGVTQKQCDQLTEMTREVIAMYGDHKFATRLSNALPHLFKALLTPGMGLTNNPTESDMRKVVTYRNTHHNFKAVRSMSAFAVPFSFAQTAEKNGMLPAEAILRKLKDPNWNMFGDVDNVDEGSASIGPYTAKPDAKTPETVQPAEPETVQPAEQEACRSPDEAEHSSETDTVDNQTIFDALSDASKFVLCAYAIVLLLESYPRMHQEWNAHYSRIRQIPILPDPYGQDRLHLPPPTRHEHPLTEADSSMISLTNRPLQLISRCVIRAA